ncbi:trichome birefringence-like protein (DUF828) isoform X2 [Wolffia australiana]
MSIWWAFIVRQYKILSILLYLRFIKTTKIIILGMGMRIFLLYPHPACQKRILMRKDRSLLRLLQNWTPGIIYQMTKNDDESSSSHSSAARMRMVTTIMRAWRTMMNFYSDISSKCDCDLYHGRWVHDPDGPLYTNKTCPIITQMQNCQGNGRPDRDYENWRWKPDQCDLPRFDPRKFLQLMQGKTLAFIGDSVARNQMESLLCILWQVETPKNRGNRLMHRWTFPSTSTTIARIWSSWLVHHTNDPIEGAGADVDKLHLDMPDEFFMEHIPKFDVIVLSSGHWFAKKSVYLLNSTVIGGQLWNPPTSMEQSMKVNHMEAYRISVETALTAIARQPNYAGLTIVRTYSPDHYEGGEWNTGGSCTGKSKPAQRVVENGFTNGMHQRQVASFWNSMQKTGAAARFRLMDITEGFGLRHDGHPGPYRSPDPNKITKRGRGGRPPSQDCLHWCMPGPVDTWNELVLEIIRREFDHANDPIPQLQH